MIKGVGDTVRISHGPYNGELAEVVSVDRGIYESVLNLRVSWDGRLIRVSRSRCVLYRSAETVTAVAQMPESTYTVVNNENAHVRRTFPSISEAHDWAAGNGWHVYEVVTTTKSTATFKMVPVKQ